MQLDRGPAGVQRAADRAGREAVDGRPAARLDVGDQLQPPGQLRLQRPGRDRGEVGLQQHVVDRLGQQRRPAPSCAFSSSPASRSRAYDARPSSPVTPRTAASVTRPEHLVGAAPRPARPLPAQQRDHRRHAGARRPGTSPGGQRRQRRQRHRAGLGHVAAGQLGRQRVPRLAGGVAGPDQPRHPRAVQPGAGQPGPPLRGRPQHPGVDQVGRQPHRVAAGVGGGGQQAGGRGDLDEQRHRSVSSTCSCRGGRLEVAHAEAAAAQRRRRLGAPQVEQQLEPAYRLERRARRGAVDLAARCAPSTPSTGTSSTRSTVVCPPRSASPTSPGTTTEPVPRGTSSRRASSSSAGRGGVLGQHGVPGVVGGRLATGCQDVLEHRPGRLGQLGQQPGDLGGSSASGAEQGRSPLTPPPARRSAPRRPRSAAAARRSTPRPGPGRPAGRSPAATAAGSAWTIPVNASCDV